MLGLLDGFDDGLALGLLLGFDEGFEDGLWLMLGVLDGFELGLRLGRLLMLGLLDGFDDGSLLGAFVVGLLVRIVGGRRTLSMIWTIPFKAIMSAVITFAVETKIFVPELPVAFTTRTVAPLAAAVA